MRRARRGLVFLWLPRLFVFVSHEKQTTRRDKIAEPGYCLLFRLLFYLLANAKLRMLQGWSYLTAVAFDTEIQ